MVQNTMIYPVSSESLLTKLSASDLNQEKVDPLETITEEDIAMEDVPHPLLDEDQDKDDFDELIVDI